MCMRDTQPKKGKRENRQTPHHIKDGKRKHCDNTKKFIMFTWLFHVISPVILRFVFPT